GREPGRAGSRGTGRDRQSRQGRRGPGRPGDEFGAGPPRDDGAALDGTLSMLTADTTQSALLPVYPHMPVRPVRGHGAWLVDEDGQEWLDAYGGHAVAATGHSHPDVVRAIADQA